MKAIGTSCSGGQLWLSTLTAIGPCPDGSSGAPLHRWRSIASMLPGLGCAAWTARTPPLAGIVPIPIPAGDGNVAVRAGYG